MFSPPASCTLQAVSLDPIADQHIVRLKRPTPSVTTHPDDPQARVGLNKCMDVLRSMEVLWPSAGRALELLAGSKVNAVGKDVLIPNNHTDRRKRTAEYSLDDSFEPDLPPDVPIPEHYASSSNYTGHFGGQEIYGMTGYNMPTATQNTSPPVPYTAPGPGFTESVNQYGFSGPLSTSVLPQLYSTGLDDRTDVSRYQQQPSHSANRYPQYWNDYSTFSQLGTAYGNSYNHAPQQQTSSQVYLNEPFNIYSCVSF
jgi:hypothetical protein